MRDPEDVEASIEEIEAKIDKLKWQGREKDAEKLERVRRSLMESPIMKRGAQTF